jgi:hypothetical protein
MNMASSLLREGKMSKDYWAKAVACSIYILSRSPTSSVQGKVPEEKWSGSKVNVSHFKIFGCVAFAHIPEELRKKLDDRSEKYIFIGYSEHSKAYRLYNLVTKKFLVSRDFKFMEDKSWYEMENNTSHNPSLELDEHQAPTKLDEHQESITRLPRLQVQNESSSSSHNDSSSQSDLDSDHNHQRMRSLRDIYDQDDNVVQFGFFSSQPTCFDEAPKKKVWVDVMNNEIESIERNNTWDLVDLPTDKNVISVKWVYKTKLNEKGEIEKHKERIVSRGFSQQPDIEKIQELIKQKSAFLRHNNKVRHKLSFHYNIKKSET